MILAELYTESRFACSLSLLHPSLPNHPFTAKCLHTPGLWGLEWSERAWKPGQGSASGCSGAEGELGHQDRLALGWEGTPRAVEGSQR